MRGTPRFVRAGFCCDGARGRLVVVLDLEVYCCLVKGGQQTAFSYLVEIPRSIVRFSTPRTLKNDTHCLFNTRGEGVALLLRNMHTCRGLPNLPVEYRLPALRIMFWIGALGIAHGVLVFISVFCTAAATVEKFTATAVFNSLYNFGFLAFKRRLIQ